MQVVSDTSIIVAILLNEPEREAILSLTADCEVAAPESLTPEIGNAFTALFKKGLLSLEQADEALQQVPMLKIRYYPLDLEQSVRISHQLGIYAYDAYMLELAERLRAHLFTLDKKLKATARQYGLRLLEA